MLANGRRERASTLVRSYSRTLARYAALASLSLAGCSERDSGVTLRLWAMGREGEVVQELTREFERLHPGVRVRVQQIPWTAAHEKMLTAHVGNATPDVAQLGNTWIAEFQALNALEALDSMVRASSVRPEKFFPGIWATNVVGGRTYGVPWYVDTRVMFYRTDLLKEAGYDELPRTWDGWRTAMERVARRPRQPGETAPRYGILLPTNEWAQPVSLALQQGSTLLDSSGTHGAFRAPEFRRAFEFYVRIFKDGLAPVVVGNEIGNLYQEFDRGTFGLYIGGPWQLGEFERRLSPAMQGSWMTAPLPHPTRTDEPGASIAGGSSLVLFSRSAHKPEAWALIEFLADARQQLEFYRLTGDLPAHIDAWADTSLARDRRTRAFLEQLRVAKPLPMVPEIERIVLRAAEAAEAVVQSGASVDQALTALDRDVDRILEKRRWLLARAGQ